VSSVIFGGGAISGETITIAIAIYGAVISTILAYLKLKEDKVDIRVEISRELNDPSFGDGTPTYNILARNFGKRSVYIDSFRLKLQCEGKEYSFRSLKDFKDGPDGDISISCKLLPDQKLKASVDWWEIYRFVDLKFKSHQEGDPYSEDFDLDLGKLSSCTLIAYLEDQLGNIHQSKPIGI